MAVQSDSARQDAARSHTAATGRPAAAAGGAANLRGETADRHHTPSSSCHDGRLLEIVTERLTLRPFQRKDVPAFVGYRSDPEVARFQSW